MRRYLLTILFTLIAAFVFSQTYTTVSTGTWDDANTWDQASYPNSASHGVTLDNNDSIDIVDVASNNIVGGTLVFNNNSILYIDAGDTLTVDSISILNNAKLYVDGALIIDGGMNMNNNSSLDVDLGGGIDIGGDVSGGNNVDIDIDGDMDVGGDFDLGSGSTVDGTGDITVEGEVDIPDGSDPGAVINDGGLPVTLLYFHATDDGGYVHITWATASEFNNDKFHLYHSADGVHWNVLVTIPGSGSSNYIMHYEYYDYIFQGDTKYYYLMQIDYDGQSEDFAAVSAYKTSDDIRSIMHVYNMSGALIGVIREYDEIFNIDEHIGIVVVKVNGRIFCKKFVK